MGQLHWVSILYVWVVLIRTASEIRFLNRFAGFAFHEQSKRAMVKNHLLFQIMRNQLTVSDSGLSLSGVLKDYLTVGLRTSRDPQ